MDLETKRLINKLIEDQVKNIDLSYKRLEKFPIQILAIEGITHLKLSHNKITEIPDSINILIDLEFLDLNNNSLTQIPSNFSSLQSLKRLRLDNNKLLFFPEVILKLKKLEHLYLNNNQIVNIPREIASLKEMKILFIANNNINNVPLEIIETQPHKSSLVSVINYFEALENGEDELFEAKLLLVGRGAVGKTSLANKIKNISYKLKNEDTTKGIDIINWTFDVPKKETKKFRVNIWDFGGQPIYYKTHQFFLTKRSFYILVWDARSEEDYNTFKYWLNVIKLLSNNSPVAIVQNKIDERIDEIEQKLLKDKFHNITGFFKVSCESNRGIDILKEHLEEHMLNLPHVGDLLPSVWIEIRNSLKNIEENYITNQHYISICNRYKLNEVKAEFLSDYLHDLGSILHFSEDPLLKEMVILKPEWATQSVYLLLDNSLAKNSFGRLSYKEIEKIWKDNGYVTKHAELIRLMEKFEMCFEVINDNARNYVIPQLLRPDKPDNFMWKSNDELHLEYQYVFMPEGIFTRLMVKLNTYIEDEKMIWRNGVIVKTGYKSKAFIENKPFEDKIIIRVIGNEKDKLITLIRLMINDIHSSLNNPDFIEKCGCICNVCINSETRGLYILKKLEEANRKGIETIQCQNSWENISIHKILFGIEKLKNTSITKNYENKVLQINKEDEKDQYYQMIDMLFNFIKEYSKNRDEIKYLKAQLDILSYKTTGRDEKQTALNILNAFYTKNIRDISNSAIGAVIIELGKIIAINI